MSYKYMRTILMFDLPTLKAKQRHDYSVFVRNLKRLGFYMLQESIYIKMDVDSYYSDMTLKRIKEIKPSEGSIFVLTITEKQFLNMEIILGSINTDVITTTDRLIEL